MSSLPIPQRFGDWETIRELGSGGQGRVFLVEDCRTRVNDDQIVTKLAEALEYFQASYSPGIRIETSRRLLSVIRDVLPHGVPKYGALKVLHHVDGSKPEGQKAVLRMQSELNALETISHPALVSILERSRSGEWFVMDYMAGGTLEDHVTKLKGDLLGALVALRPVVDAVATLHAKNIVHRDIKPQNIFVRSDSSLVLGDCGLAIDIGNTGRLTETYENAGSRDWMPGWAMGIRLDEVKPTFDVFSLGKVLWAMVAGRSKLQLWYHHKSGNELEEMFPTDSSILWARQILDNCIVEDEKHCLPSARELLGWIDHIMTALRRGGQVLRREKGYSYECRVCGLGRYYCMTPDTSEKTYECDRCGNIQQFSGDTKPAWTKKK